MFDRVSPAGIAIGRRAQLQSLQSEMARATAEMSANRKADPARELGVGASLLYKLYDDIQQGEAIKNSTKMAGERLSATQTALTSIGKLMDQMSPETLKADVLKGYGTLASHAREVLASMTDLLNTHFDGQNLFGGTDSAKPPLAASTGLLDWAKSQKDLAVAAQPLDASNVPEPMDETDAAALITTFDSMFANVQRADAGSPDYGTSFYGLVYQSTSRTSLAGTTDAEADAPSLVRIGAGETLSYNVRADNPAFRDVFKSLALLATLDAPSTEMGEKAKTAILDEAGQLMRGARAQLTNVAGVLGSKEQRLSQVSEIQDRAIAAATAQINDLEGVDYYTLSDRVSAMTIQLNATYAITAQISKISLVNYL